jgi:hypothetical protein
LVRGALNDFTFDKRRMFQNETHFVYNPIKDKMNQTFNQKEFLSDFPKRFKAEWQEVQNKIYAMVNNLFALSIHEAPGLTDQNVATI